MLESAVVPLAPAADAAQERAALAVARGICRLFARNDIWCLAEMPLRNGRRADLMGVDAKDRIVIVEIKVSRADLLGDGKWRDYLDYCDRFYWAVPESLAGLLDDDHFLPDAAGLLVADRYDAAIRREALFRPLAPARRKAEWLNFARRAARRLSAQIDPTLGFGS